MKKESEKVGLKLNIQKKKIMASGPIASWGNSGNSVRLFWGAPKSLQMVIVAMKLKDAYSLDFPCVSDGKVSTYNVGDPGLIPGSGRSSGEGNGNPLQCSCLENPRDGGAWWAAVYGVA